MLPTIGCMLPDALAGLPVSFMTNGLIRHQRLHPPFGWGGLTLLASFTLLLVAANTRWWITWGIRLAS